MYNSSPNTAPHRRTRPQTSRVSFFNVPPNERESRSTNLTVVDTFGRRRRETPSPLRRSSTLDGRTRYICLTPSQSRMSWLSKPRTPSIESNTSTHDVSWGYAESGQLPVRRSKVPNSFSDGALMKKLTGNPSEDIPVETNGLQRRYQRNGSKLSVDSNSTSNESVTGILKSRPNNSTHPTEWNRINVSSPSLIFAPGTTLYDYTQSTKASENYRLDIVEPKYNPYVKRRLTDSSWRNSPSLIRDPDSLSNTSPSPLQIRITPPEITTNPIQSTNETNRLIIERKLKNKYKKNDDVPRLTLTKQKVNEGDRGPHTNVSALIIK